MDIVDEITHVMSHENWSRVIRKIEYKELRQRILDATQFLPTNCTFPERVHAVKNRLTSRPKCIMCELLHCNWNGDTHTYRRFCSNRVCKYKHDSVIEKRKNTSMEKFGVSNPLASESIKSKCRETMTQKFGAPYASQVPSLLNKIQQTNLNRYGYHATCMNNEIRQKQQKTCNDRYGTNTPLENASIQNKARNTVLEKYGVVSTTQIPHIKEKQINTLVERYGVTSPSHNDEFKFRSRCSTKFAYIVLPYTDNAYDLNKLLEEYETNTSDTTILTQYDLEIMHHDLQMTHLEMSERLGVASTTINKWCSECNIQTIYHRQSYIEKSIGEYVSSLYGGKIIYNDRVSIKPKEIDILLPDLGIGFEINGITWHSEVYGGKSPKYHSNKSSEAKDVGIQLIHITSYDWFNKCDIVKSRIAAKLGIFEQRLYARNMSISPINSKKQTEFFNTNHLQSTCGSNVCYGLFSGDELIAAMSFGKPRFAVKSEWELLRFCTKLNTTVVGGASKLFAHFLKNHKPKNIITYSDKTWNAGDVYLHLGFTYSHTSAPNFWVLKLNSPNNTLEHRMKYQKHKLSKILPLYDSNVTAHVNLITNGYDKYWDCGNDVWFFTTETKNRS